MDLSKYKKVSTNHSTTKFLHPDGHEITLAHKALDPKTKAMLDAFPMHFAEGGSVDQPQNPQQPIINVNVGGQPQSPQVSQMLQPNLQAKAEDFASLPNAQKPLGQIIPSPDPNVISDEQWTKMDQAQRYAYLNPAAAPTKSLAESVSSGLGNIADQSQMARQQELEKYGAAPAPIPQAPVQQAANPGVTQLSQAPRPNTDPYGVDAYNKNYMQGLNEQKSGLMQEAAATGQLGNKQAEIENQASQRLSEIQSNFEKESKPLLDEQAALQADLKNGSIDPNRFLNKMGGGQKVLTAIGLFLGGLGAGLTKTDNEALGFLGNQIDRDIKAQQLEMDKKNNLLSANLKRYGNLRDAMEITKSNYLDIVSHKLKESADNAQSDIARARALQAAGDIDRQSAAIISQIAMRKAMLGGDSGGAIDPGMKIRALIPEGQQNEYFKELEEAQRTVKMRDNILNAFDQVRKINTVGNSLASPIQTARQVSAIVEPLVAQMSKDTAGRYTPADADAIRTLFSKKLDNDNTAAIIRNQLNKMATEKMNFNRLKTLGIDVDSMGRYAPGGDKKIQLGPPVVK